LKKKIKRLIKELEREKGIKVLFAVESGSRLWGINSENSDYDVRFVFKKKLNDYLSTRITPDIITETIDDIDLVGFDIKKFVSLLKGSNPSCIEWLTSEILYCGKRSKVLKEFATNKFNRFKLYYHYKSMCKSTFEKYIKTNKGVTIKRYLYCLRGLINCIWVVRNESLPYNDIESTISCLETDFFSDDNSGKPEIPDDVLNLTKELIKIKREGIETSETSRIEIIDTYMDEFLGSDNLENFINSEDYNINVLDLEVVKLIRGFYLW